VRAAAWSKNLGTTAMRWSEGDATRAAANVLATSVDQRNWSSR
jgi:hypothetical protein